MLSLATLPDIIIDEIKSYVIFTPKDNQELKSTVDLWCDNMKKAHKLYGHISSWDTIYITDMYELFRNKYEFNSVISSWNVSNVESMSFMFNSATSFNQPLNDWNVSSVIFMREMFCKAYEFNRPLNNWNVSNVENMEGIFNGLSIIELPKWYKKKD
tara:strand:- start:37 stop:507 length:471 start_codon:yes stop_codon:yes gene_type:complete